MTVVSASIACGRISKPRAHLPIRDACRHFRAGPAIAIRYPGLVGAALWEISVVVPELSRGHSRLPTSRRPSTGSSTYATDADGITRSFKRPHRSFARIAMPSRPRGAQSGADAHYDRYSVLVTARAFTTHDMSESFSDGRDRTCEPYIAISICGAVVPNGVELTTTF